VDVLDQVAALEQAAGQVDGDRVGEAEVLLPDAWPGARLRFTAHSDSGTIRPVSSASGMKSPGGTSTPPRCQRISASAPTMLGRAHVDLGLVVQHQFVALDGLVQRGLELELVAPAPGQLAGCRWRGALRPAALAVHRHVGVAHQVGHVQCRRAGTSRCPRWR
jgi:hypothetical protein